MKFLPKLSLIVIFICSLAVSPATSFANTISITTPDTNVSIRREVRVNNQQSTVNNQPTKEEIEEKAEVKGTRAITIPTVAIPTVVLPTRPVRVTSGNTTPTPTPTKKITPTPTKTARDWPVRSNVRAVPTPTPTRKITPRPTPGTSSIPANEKRDYIMKAINDYRASLGLSSVKISTETCAFAKTRAKEVSTDFSHAGFQSRINSHTIPYASWSSITENIAMTSDYKRVVTMWINSAGHAENMRKNTPFVCVEDYGNYYAYEGMKP